MGNFEKSIFKEDKRFQLKFNDLMCEVEEMRGEIFAYDEDFDVQDAPYNPKLELLDEIEELYYKCMNMELN